MKDTHVVVGVTGGIAAYKALEVVSRLRKLGAEVRVVMTENATKFVTPLSFAELSGHAVALDMFEHVNSYDVEHIAWASWADAYLIVPATANVVGKIANGIADDMLTTQLMATKAPIFLCPAMNTGMYTNAIYQENESKLRSHGYHVMTPASGELACGTSGLGRLPEPVDIVRWFSFHLHRENRLAGKRIIVTAGGTKEPIDPVRYIGNLSSGKMGFAIAEQAALLGANVTLIAAENNLVEPYGLSEYIVVGSARDMKEAVDERYEEADAVIMAAAVADYRVAKVADQKIKKMESMSLELVKNPDILLSLGERKMSQKLVGFAAETEKVLENGRKKLERKNLDMLVANDVSRPDAGFNVDTNVVSLLFRNGDICKFGTLKKDEVAKLIVLKLVKLFEL